MPTYDYECDKCGHRFELFQSITENPKRKCPECRKSTLRRLFGTGAALMFKGSGFYQTDYRSESYKKASEADKKSSGDSTSSSSESTAKSDPGSQPSPSAKPQESAKASGRAKKQNSQ
jgi:putative FmdB family regulatory protein